MLSRGNIGCKIFFVIKQNIIQIIKSVNNSNIKFIIYFIRRLYARVIHECHQFYNLEMFL